MLAEHYIDPLHFQNTLNSYKGAAFSVKPSLLQSAWMRPHNRSEDFDNLYFVGAGTHPGAGVPAVLSSGKIAAENKPTLYVDGAYDFVDVRDVADGLIAAAENGKRGESYILSGQKISVRYLLETVREITGQGAMLMKMPFELAKWAAQFMPRYYQLTKTSPRFTPYSLEVLKSNSNISHEKATRELGYQPRTLYESISDTVKWFLQQKTLVPIIIKDKGK